MEKKLTNVTAPVTTKEQLKGFDYILNDNFNFESLIKNLPMEKMVYTPYEIELKILAKGNFFGYDFYVVNYGTHPCCYVRIPVGHKYYDVHFRDVPFFCHGGLSFGERDFFDTNNKNVSIIYGSSFKEAKASKPIRITLEQLQQYKNNYSYVEVIEDDKDYFIGWDYGHAGDFRGIDMRFGFGSKDKKYTTEELVLDCLKSIKGFVKTLIKEED